MLCVVHMIYIIDWDISLVRRELLYYYHRYGMDNIDDMVTISIDVRCELVVKGCKFYTTISNLAVSLISNIVYPLRSHMRRRRVFHGAVQYLLHINHQLQ